jgi:hypothetical protein
MRIIYVNSKIEIKNADESWAKLVKKVLPRGKIIFYYKFSKKTIIFYKKFNIRKKTTLLI